MTTTLYILSIALFALAFAATDDAMEERGLISPTSRIERLTQHRDGVMRSLDEALEQQEQLRARQLELQGLTEDELVSQSDLSMRETELRWTLQTIDNALKPDNPMRLVAKIIEQQTAEIIEQKNLKNGQETEKITEQKDLEDFSNLSKHEKDEFSLQILLLLAMAGFERNNIFTFIIRLVKSIQPNPYQNKEERDAYKDLKYKIEQIQKKRMVISGPQDEYIEKAKSAAQLISEHIPNNGAYWKYISEIEPLLNAVI